VLWLVPGLAFTKYRCEFVNLFCIYAFRIIHIHTTVINSGRAHATQHRTHCGLWLWLQSWLMPQPPHRLQNDLKFVEWDVKPCPTQLYRDGVGCHGGRRQRGRRQLPRAHWRRDKCITFNAGTYSVVKTKRPTLFEWQR